MDWQPGDLALCVKQCISPPQDLVVGRVYKVERVYIDAKDIDDEGDLGVGLALIGRPAFTATAYCASLFRKINPHTPDAEDAETILLLNGIPVPELT